MIAKVVAKFDASVAGRLKVRSSTVKLRQDVLEASALPGDVCVVTILVR